MKKKKRAAKKPLTVKQAKKLINTPPKNRSSADAIRSREEVPPAVRNKRGKGITRNRNEILSAKEKIFCEAYIRTGNKSAAALEAGYDEDKPLAAAYLVLMRPRVQLEISRQTEKLFRDQEASTRRIFAEAESQAFYDPADLFDERGNFKAIKDMPVALRHALTGFEVSTVGKAKTKTILTKLKVAGRLPALEFLAKLKGLLSNKLEISGPEGGAIPIAVARAMLRDVEAVETQSTKVSDEEIEDEELPDSVDLLEARKGLEDGTGEERGADE